MMHWKGLVCFCFSILVISTNVKFTNALHLHTKSLLRILPTQLPLELIYKEPIHFESLDISFHVVSSAILNNVPWLKLHHIVLLTAENKNKLGGSLTCAIDFSPVNQTQTSTLLELVKGNYVPGEIRMKFITGTLFKAIFKV